MTKANKSLKTRYRAKLLEEFNLLKSEEAMQEVLEYTRFVRGEEKELQKIKLPKNTSLTKMK